jgi:hypothetical protein
MLKDFRYDGAARDTGPRPEPTPIRRGSSSRGYGSAAASSAAGLSRVDEDLVTERLIGQARYEGRMKWLKVNVKCPCK